MKEKQVFCMKRTQASATAMNFTVLKSSVPSYLFIQYNAKGKHGNKGKGDGKRNQLHQRKRHHR